ncbi:HIT family protein [Streptomyces sp. col6]|uniref:HIT family protein n=1 Tax=Streptomyces sp. col6 TaxID=2478958 RepID=UPI001CD05352|nr:HIT domain-containing protein [Streptomyces sp. col6]
MINEGPHSPGESIHCCADQLISAGSRTASLDGCTWRGRADPATVVREWPDDVLAIRPCSGGVNAGHVLVLLRVHIADAGADLEVTASVMRRAAELMAEHPAASLITSKESPATQTVVHLHIHVLPRTDGDALPLPWTPQARCY